MKNLTIILSLIFLANSVFAMEQEERRSKRQKIEKTEQKNEIPNISGLPYGIFGKDVFMIILEFLPADNKFLLEQIYRKDIKITPKIATNIVDALLQKSKRVYEEAKSHMPKQLPISIDEAINLTLSHKSAPIEIIKPEEQLQRQKLCNKQLEFLKKLKIFMLNCPEYNKNKIDEYLKSKVIGMTCYSGRILECIIGQNTLMEIMIYDRPLSIQQKALIVAIAIAGEQQTWPHNKGNIVHYNPQDKHLAQCNFDILKELFPGITITTNPWLAKAEL